MTFRQLDPLVLVADRPMLPADMAEAEARGVTLAVNNRPDGEAPDQVGATELLAAARAAGLASVHIPVAGGLDEEQAMALIWALDTAEGPAVLFCASGTRSTFLWALARALQGEPPEALARSARAAGYDLTPLLPWLEQIAARRPRPS